MTFESNLSYILFAFILSSFIEGDYSSHAYAASIPVIESSQSPQYNLSKIKKRLFIPVTNKQDGLYSPNSIQPGIFIQPSNPFIAKQQINEPVYSVKNTDTDLYQQGKDFIQNNKENLLLQDTLVFLNQSKNLFKETDLMIHNLSQDILLSAGLEAHNQQDLFFTQQQDINTNKAPSHTKSYSSYDGNYSQQIQTARLEEMEQQYISSEKHTFSDSNLMKAIFDIRNLYYIFGLITVIFLIKKVIKFMFLKDQYNSQRRR